MPLVRRTRHTLRSAEFGFFGVVVYTRTHTPRRCGHDLSAGEAVLYRAASRPWRMSWLMVGIGSSMEPGLGRGRGGYSRGPVCQGRPRARTTVTGDGSFWSLSSGSATVGGREQESYPIHAEGAPREGAPPARPQGQAGAEGRGAAGRGAGRERAHRRGARGGGAPRGGAEARGALAAARFHRAPAARADGDRSDHLLPVPARAERRR